MPKTIQDSSTPPFAEFLGTIPSPLLTVLVGLAPHIARVRHIIEIVSWKSSWEESWLTLAVWWAACLLGDVALRYVLPIATISVLLAARWTLNSQTSPPPITEDSLQKTITDMNTILALLPTIPSPPTVVLPILLRVSAILYIPYLLLTYFVRLRVLLAIAGTILLTWRARWAGLIRRGIWRSAYIRWVIYRSWALLSGQPLPPPTLSPQSNSTASELTVNSKEGQNPTNSIRFLFTVYENQRWWMGLDWTAALLPGERPSWCSSSQQAVAPPSAFALPAPTTVYMQEGDRRVKRTARWRWEEEEWKVVIHKEGGDLTRVERPLPMPEKETAASTASSKILRAAGKMRQASMGGSVGSRGEDSSPERRRSEEGEAGKASEKQQHEDEEVFTDLDGWVYGDNKWESISSKGGMGKYTRYRRWTRIAVLSETVEPVAPGEVGIWKDGPSTSTTTSPPKPVTVEPHNDEHRSSLELHAESMSTTSSADSDRSRLRQRLQAAVKGH
ncbi:integral peroxisomal membrane peroxin-domain-containing protein [Abortiporus biennis]|nr:integral peroxisomal membrane peroxin-domain-containing protein [Abortiporus biennis]